MASHERPLSPFLHYRWMFTNTLSILHRISGVALALAFFVLVYWLSSAAAGREQYAQALRVLGAWPMQLILLGTCFAFCYHLLNGIRHLFFDFGHGFELPVARASARVVSIGAVVLALLVWWLLRQHLSGTA